MNEKTSECKLIGNIILVNQSGKSFENATFYVSMDESQISTPFHSKVVKGVRFIHTTFLIVVLLSISIKIE